MKLALAALAYLEATEHAASCGILGRCSCDRRDQIAAARAALLEALRHEP